MDDFKVHIEPDIDEKLHKMPEIALTAMDTAQQIADVAIGIAPVLSGAYKSGITVQKTKTGARVFAADQKSSWIEFGIPSRGLPAHWTLRTAAASLGLKFKKGGG